MIFIWLTWDKTIDELFEFGENFFVIVVSSFDLISDGDGERFRFIVTADDRCSSSIDDEDEFISRVVDAAAAAAKKNGWVNAAAMPAEFGS